MCDSQGGHGARAVGMGGVMGGLDTEISATTTDVLLEAAHWDPITIARTARRHKLGSEASRRYERGVDTALAPVAVERALRLMQEFGGGEIEDVVHGHRERGAPHPITMDVDFPTAHRRHGVPGRRGGGVPRDGRLRGAARRATS